MDGDEVHLHVRRTRPFNKTMGKSDYATLSRDNGEAAFPCITLTNGVRGDHTHTSTSTKKQKGLPIEGSA